MTKRQKTQEQTHDVCPICYENLIGKPCVTCPGCGKTVHKSCADTWESTCEKKSFSGGCAMCRYGAQSIRCSSNNDPDVEYIVIKCLVDTIRTAKMEEIIEWYAKAFPREISLLEAHAMIVTYHNNNDDNQMFSIPWVFFIGPLRKSFFEGSELKLRLKFACHTWNIRDLSENVIITRQNGIILIRPLNGVLSDQSRLLVFESLA